MRGMFRLVLLATAVLSAAASCSDGRGGDPAEVAGRTACLYYENLLHGRFAEYVDGFYRPDSIPDGYRAQLIDNARMFMAQQNDEHHGIKSVSLGRATADTVRNVAHAFLMLSYGDSTKEEVVVPMVRVHGLWMMR